MPAAHPRSRELAEMVLAVLDVYAALLESQGQVERAGHVRQRAAVVAQSDPTPGLAVVMAVGRDLRDLAKLISSGAGLEALADRIEARAHQRANGRVPDDLLATYSQRRAADQLGYPNRVEFGRLLDALRQL